MEIAAIIQICVKRLKSVEIKEINLYSNYQYLKLSDSVKERAGMALSKHCNTNQLLAMIRVICAANRYIKEKKTIFLH